MTARHDVIQAESAWFPVSRACELLSTSKAGYYRSQTPTVSPAATRHQMLTTDIGRVFRASDTIFGHRVVQQKLAHEGVTVSVGTVASIMAENGWKARRMRAFKRTTRQDAGAKFFPDLVRRDFTAEVPGTVLYGDITYLRTGEGWLYLATVIDMCTRMVVGWALDDNMKAPLVRKALHMAKGRGYVAKTGIFHSDRGSQYTSKEFTRWCRDNGVTQSMGATGTCWDNAAAESFFSIFKNDFYHHYHFDTRQQARTSTVKFIEWFYNRYRPHGHNEGALPPAEAMRVKLNPVLEIVILAAA